MNDRNYSQFIYYFGPDVQNVILSHLRPSALG